MQNKSYLLGKKNESLNFSVEQFERTSNQLSQRLIQQQKATARTSGLKNQVSVSRSKSQPNFRQSTAVGEQRLFNNNSKSTTTPLLPSQYSSTRGDSSRVARRPLKRGPVHGTAKGKSPCNSSPVVSSKGLLPGGGLNAETRRKL